MEEAINLSKRIIQSHSNLATEEMSITIQEALKKPLIRTVFKETPEIGLGVVKVIVTRFLDSFGFSTKQTENQIEMIAIDTLDHFSYESLEDIILFFKMARSGKFGTTKRGVDSNLIFGEWFPMYLEAKYKLREELIIQKQQNIRQEKINSLEDVYVSYRKNLLRQLKEKQQAYIENLVKNMDRQMLEDTICSWNKDKELKKHVHLLKIQRRTIKIYK